MEASGTGGMPFLSLHFAPKADIDRVACRCRGTSLREHALSEATEWLLVKDGRANVRFLEQSGHWAEAAKCPLLTRCCLARI